MASSDSLDDGGVWDEVHALCGRRDRATVDRFLAAYGTGRHEGQADYPYPQLVDDPERIFGNLDECLEFLLSNSNSEYALYWSGTRTNLSLHFLQDGSLVCAIQRDPRCDIAPQLCDLANCVDALFAVAEGEAPPPDDAAEFRRVARARPWAIVEGKPSWRQPA